MFSIDSIFKTRSTHGAFAALIICSLIVAFAPVETAYSQGKQKNIDLHPGTTDFPTMFKLGVANFDFADTSSSAWADTLVVPQYREGDHVYITRKTKGARVPGTIDNAPWISHLTPVTGYVRRDTVIMNTQKADSATYSIQVTKNPAVR